MLGKLTLSRLVFAVLVSVVLLRGGLLQGGPLAAANTASRLRLPAENARAGALIPAGGHILLTSTHACDEVVHIAQANSDDEHITSACDTAGSPLPGTTSSVLKLCCPLVLKNLDFLTIQEGNWQPKTEIQPKQSQELEDNCMGTDLGSYDPGYHNPQVVYPIGFKWIRISFNTDPLNWQYVETEPGQYMINSACDNAITGYANNGINIVLNLGVGSWENRLDITRFRTEGDIVRYCNFARFMVHHFKDRIRYYEIWNEPNDIAVQDYANLVRRVVPVIREEYPGAKIVIGAVGGEWISGYPGYGESQRYTVDIDYLKGLLRSGVAPLVDVVSWHPFYGTRPDDPYYQNYHRMVEEIKQLAASKGFRGEYLVEEIVWRTPGDTLDEQIQRVTETVATKYFTRSMVMSRGLNLIVSIALPGAHDPTLPKVHAIHNICHIMARVEPTSFPVQIASEGGLIKSYKFAFPNGDRMVALWNDIVAEDYTPGVKTTVTLQSFSARNVVGIDTLYGVQQTLYTRMAGSNLVIPNLLVRDYPLILRVSR